MTGKMACITKKGNPIEEAIAEACALYEAHYGQPPNVVKINSANPASATAPEGVRVERVKNVLPGSAWAGRE